MILAMSRATPTLRHQYRKVKGEFRQIRQRSFFFAKVLLSTKVNVVVGASGCRRRGWITSEQEFLDLLREEHWKRVFRWRKIDRLLAEHVFEHLSIEEAGVALRICHKYMKKGGRFRIAVPDGYSPNKEYIESVEPGGTGVGSDDHKTLFNVDSLESLLTAAGFFVSRLEYFNANGEFQQKTWSSDDGMITRSRAFDPRNSAQQIRYTSLILDGFKE